MKVHTRLMRCQRWEAWVPAICDAPRYSAVGRSKAEAIGNLYLSMLHAGELSLTDGRYEGTADVIDHTDGREGGAR